MDVGIAEHTDFDFAPVSERRDIRRVVGMLDFVEIEEAVGSETVVTNLTNRSAELHLGKDVVIAKLLHEFLVAYNPACRECREETEAVSRGELLGAVVTYIYFGKIAGIESVSGTGGHTDHIERNLTTHILTQITLEHDHTGHGMLVGKRAVIVGLHLHVEEPPATS